jgi:hypothetical protein
MLFVYIVKQLKFHSGVVFPFLFVHGKFLSSLLSFLPTGVTKYDMVPASGKSTHQLKLSTTVVAPPRLWLPKYFHQFS